MTSLRDVVINLASYGRGLDLTPEAQDLLCQYSPELKGLVLKRDNPTLVRVALELQQTNPYSDLRVVCLPKDIDWTIVEDALGAEYVATPHKTFHHDEHLGITVTTEYKEKHQ